MFIVSLNYICPLEKVEAYINEHVCFLKQAYENGHFIASGRKEPRTGGVILSKIKTKQDLLSILRKDPFYKHDIATFDIIEFVPTMVASGYEVLKNE